MMVLIAATVALLAVLAVGLATAVRRPADVPRVVRLAGLAITAGVALLLAPLTVQDSGAAALYLLGVPVLATLPPLLAHRLGRAAGIVDLLAALVIGGWGLLLALGIGVAFLPGALLYAAAAAGSLAPRPAASG
ncbi:hypothetical protein [Plantactinospora sp. CA-290183]|uniref:hypothetical protein n=1 Tax=Plantactinospora sp. CA-290183 TaxID=3240006 RepID=UPI003D8BC8C0